MNLLLTGCFNYSVSQIQRIKDLGFNVYFMQQESEDVPLPLCDVDAIVCNGFFLSHDIDEFVNLKYIQLTSAGLDRVPVDKIQSRGISLFNARGVYSIPMAEWALFRVLEFYKQGRFFNENQKVGCWYKHRGLRELFGAKVAVIGAGNVGQEVGKRFKALGAETVGFDVHTNKIVGFDDMVLINSLQERVNEFDIVIVTAPLLPTTKGLISREVMLNMKTNAILVNIARGGLIDEEAMCDVLEKRQDLFAALDVFETEPLLEKSPLWKLTNVAISPHNSFVSDGNNRRMFDVILSNLEQFIR